MAARESTFREIGAIRSDVMGFRNIWGIRDWRRAVYGFTAGGVLIDIDARTGAARVVTTSGARPRADRSRRRPVPRARTRAAGDPTRIGEVTITGIASPEQPFDGCTARQTFTAP